MSETDKKYDDMTPAEREAYDKAEKEREDAEQAQLPYTWTQTLQDVDMTIPLSSSLRARDLDIAIKNKSLKIGVKGKDPIVNDQLFKDIKVDDSTWSLEDGKVIQIHLEKLDQMTWWPHVAVSAPKINTKRIQPENSRLDDLDGDTRAMVEKMMFDQRQKAANKPSSDELKKQQIFENFKKQHPEMDFSQVKMD